MTDVVESSSVGCGHEPVGKRIDLQARRSPSSWIRRWRGWPDIGSCAERLLEFKSSVTLVSVLNRAVGSAGGSRVNSKSVLNSTVAVVANFDLVRGTSWESAVDTGSPRDVSSQISRYNAVLVSSRRVNVGYEMHVIDLSIEISTTTTDD